MQRSTKIRTAVFMDSLLKMILVLRAGLCRREDLQTEYIKTVVQLA